MHIYYHLINDSNYGYARLHFSFFCILSLSALYPGKKRKKHDQSFIKQAINFLAHSAECHYCNVSKYSVQNLFSRI